MGNSRKQETIFLDVLRKKIEELSTRQGHNGQPLIKYDGNGYTSIIIGFDQFYTSHIDNKLMTKFIVSILRNNNLNYDSNCANKNKKDDNLPYFQLLDSKGKGGRSNNLSMKFMGADEWTRFIVSDTRINFKNQGLPQMNTAEFVDALYKFFMKQPVEKVTDFLTEYFPNNNFDKNKLVRKSIHEEKSEYLREKLKIELVAMAERLAEYIEEMLERYNYFGPGKVPKSEIPGSSAPGNSTPESGVPKGSAPESNILPESNASTSNTSESGVSESDLPDNGACIIYAGKRRIEKSVPKPGKKPTETRTKEKNNVEIFWGIREAVLNNLDPVVKVIFSNKNIDDSDTMFIYNSPDKKGYIAVLEPFSGFQTTRVIHLFDEQLEKYKNSDGTIAWGDVAHHYGDMSIDNFRKIQGTCTLYHRDEKDYLSTLEGLIKHELTIKKYTKNQLDHLRVIFRRIYGGELAPNIADVVEEVTNPRAEELVTGANVKRVAEVLGVLSTQRRGKRQTAGINNGPKVPDEVEV